MIIYLIGMPGAGKSKLGKKLSQVLNYQFIDMDEYIEKKACMFIDEILETNTLKELSNLDNVVISTGGGIIKNKLHKEIMKKGKCIYLKVPVEILENRVYGTEDIRPLLKTKSISTLYAERKDLYEYFQDITIENINLDDSISQILEELK